MAQLTDIEIAQACRMKPVTEIAAGAGIDEKYIEQYGRYKAKLDLSYLADHADKRGRLVLVTAITPTPAGEGKTTTTIGLADGLRRIVFCKRRIALGGAGASGRDQKSGACA